MGRYGYGLSRSGRATWLVGLQHRTRARSLSLSPSLPLTPVIPDASVAKGGANLLHCCVLVGNFCQCVVQMEWTQERVTEFIER